MLNACCVAGVVILLVLWSPGLQGQAAPREHSRAKGLGMEKLQNSTFIFVHCYINVLRTSYSHPSFELGSFLFHVYSCTSFYSQLSLSREAPQCCAEGGSDAGLQCISVSKNLDMNSNENLFQCCRYLTLRRNCIPVVCVLHLVQLLLISPPLVILSRS